MTDAGLRNERLSDEAFFRERKEVLAQWSTGKDVDLDEAIEFHKRLPPSKVYAGRLAEAKRHGDTLIFTYTGTPTLEGQMELARYVMKEGGADLCNTHVDAFTRNHMFQKAEEAVNESLKLGKAMLNGFPVIIHGVAGNRKLIEAYPAASKISGCSCDWRLNAEIGFAGGHSSITAGPFISFFSYNQLTSLETAIRNWQYLYRLIGYYEERGAPIVYRPDGVLSDFLLLPQSMSSACRILESLMAAKQGVRHISLNSFTAGNLAQDIAGTIALPKLAREYLDRFGYKNVETFSMTTGINGRYPYDTAQAFAALSAGPLVAAVAGLQEVCIRTIDEAHEIPKKENNAASVRCAKMVLNLYKGQKPGFEEAQSVKDEVRIQELEIRAIVDNVLKLGEGDVAVGSVRAVASGGLDIPFSTARSAARRVLGVRDAKGALRFLDPGNLPFGKEILDYNREKIAERARVQRREITYEAVINDLMSVGEGQLISR